LHIYPSDVVGDDHTIELEVVEEDSEQIVRSHMNTFVHYDFAVEDESDVLYYRDGSPITFDGDTRWGDVDERENSEKHIVRSYTADDGVVELRANHDPSITDPIFHRIGVWTDFNIDLPTLSTQIPTDDVPSAKPISAVETGPTAVPHMSGQSAGVIA